MDRGAKRRSKRFLLAANVACLCALGAGCRSRLEALVLRLADLLPLEPDGQANVDHSANSSLALGLLAAAKIAVSQFNSRRTGRENSIRPFRDRVHWSDHRSARSGWRDQSDYSGVASELQRGCIGCSISLEVNLAT